MNLLERCYALGLSLKYRSALKNQGKLPFRVISIGNLTVGGTGKTPAAIALAAEAQRRGLAPIILTRGYKGTLRGPVFVTRGGQPLLGCREAGDEPLLMAERLSSVPIVKGADRLQSGLFAIEELGLLSISKNDPEPVFILDDGFQHWRLHRDCDVVLIDGLDPFGNGKLLPSGRLREPLSGISRADVVVITRCGEGSCEADRITARIREFNPHAPVFRTGQRVLGIRGQGNARHDVSWLNGKRVFGFCGLGNPFSFQQTMGSLQAEVCGFRSFRDHHPYRQADLSEISREADKLGASWLLTTEKDAVKMRGLDLPANLLIIEVEFAAEAGFYDAVFIPGLQR